jgi:hypothetical protein
MSKQIKIFLVIGVILILAVVVYLLWPEGEQAAHRGVERGAATGQTTE